SRDQRESLRQRARILMILGQPIDHRGQRDDSRRRDYSRLPHTATEHFAGPMRASDKFAAPTQKRTHRASESLRQAKRYGIGAARDFLRRRLERERGVEDSRAVEMQRNFSVSLMRGV